MYVKGSVQGTQYVFCSIRKNGLISVFIFALFRVCWNIVQSGVSTADLDFWSCNKQMWSSACSFIEYESASLFREQYYFDTKEKKLI
jgi:hypothetical protein